MVENTEFEKQVLHDTSILWSLFAVMAHALGRSVQSMQDYYELLIIDSQNYRKLEKAVGKAKAREYYHGRTQQELLKHEDYRLANQIIQKCKEIQYLGDKITDNMLANMDKNAFANQVECFDSVEAEANYICRLILHAMNFPDPAGDTLKLESTAKMLAKNNFVPQEIIDKFVLK